MTKIELQVKFNGRSRDYPLAFFRNSMTIWKLSWKKETSNPNLKTDCWNGIAGFSDDFLTQRIQPPLDKSENLFIAISSIVVAELWYGVQKSQLKEQNRMAPEAFLRPFTILDFDTELLRHMLPSVRISKVKEKWSEQTIC
jgi:hypothetical protein